MSVSTIDSVIEQLQEAREAFGGDCLIGTFVGPEVKPSIRLHYEDRVIGRRKDAKHFKGILLTGTTV